MSAVVLIFDAYILLLVFVLFLYHRNRFKKARYTIGSILYQWSIMYNVHTPRGILIWILLLAYLCQAICFTLNGSTRTYGVHSLVVFLFSLGFYQRWIVAFGEKGFIRRLNMIAWKDVVEWQSDMKGSVSLTLRFEDSLKKVRIRLPKSCVEDVESLLIRSVKIQKE